MSASSKDEVYNVLRKQGIHAIKVNERIAPVVRKGFGGLRKRDWMLLAGGVIGVIAAVAWGVTYRFAESPSQRPSHDMVSRPAPPTESFVRIMAVARQLQDAHQRAELSVDHNMLSDFDAIRAAKDVTPYRAEIAKGRAVVESSRRNVKRVYFPLYRALPANRPDEQREAQRLYGSLMSEIDGMESWLDETEFMMEQVLRDGAGKK